MALFTAFNSNSKEPLSSFKYNVYSQFGEDGIVEKIFDIIGTKSKVAIEFGAWDGFWLSNTALLWSQKGWKGVLLECDHTKAAQLKQRIKGYNCIGIHAKVGTEPNNRLEELLRSNNIPLQADLLSIDIDGDDYYVFQTLDQLKPRVVICEYNPTFPTWLDIYSPYGTFSGCSVGALVRVAEQKGYKLVAITDVNCFFVLQEDYPLFKEFETKLHKIKIDSYLKFICTDYAGKYAVLGEKSDWPYGVSGRLPYKLLGSQKPSPITVSA